MERLVNWLNRVDSVVVPPEDGVSGRANAPSCPIRVISLNIHVLSTSWVLRDTALPCFGTTPAVATQLLTQEGKGELRTSLGLIVRVLEDLTLC
jgi:hypothetical protein